MCKKAKTDQNLKSQNINPKPNRKSTLRDILNNAINIAILFSVVIAVFSLFFTVVKFWVNEDIMLDEFTQTMDYVEESISDTSYKSNKIIELRMEYLERISQMHKQASSSDLFVFMYGFLSSVLIGISAVLIKRGESQVKEINDKAERIEKKLIDIYPSVDNFEQQSKNLKDLINNNRDNIKSLKTETQKNQIIIDNNKSTIMINYMLMLITVSLFMLLNYKSSKENEYLVRFKENLKQLENISLHNTHKLSSKTYLGKLSLMVGNVRTVYESITNDPEFSCDVDETHQKYIKKYLDNIECSLKSMSETQPTAD
jgi:predicted PurR-regulated permease PerM